MNNILSISVLYVVANLDVGGAERHILQILPKLDSTSIQPKVFTLINKGILAEDLRSKGIDVISHADECDWQSLNKFKRILRVLAGSYNLFFYLRKKRPDIVHFFLPMPYLFGGVTSLLAGMSCLVMSRRSLNYYQKNFYLVNKIERYLHKKMRAVLGNSQAVINDLKREGVTEKQVKLIYNGVEMPIANDIRKKNKLRDEFSLKRNQLVLIMVANIIPYKGHQDLLTSLSIINNDLPDDWILLCVGHDGHNYLAKLKLLASELGISDNVIFTGRRDDVAELFQVSDISVLCSHEEGFSNAILEAMANALPSVVTDVGGNSEAVRNHIDGFVVPVKSPRELASKILELASNQTLRKSFGLSAYNRVMKEFSLDNCILKYEAIYRELAHQFSKDKYQ